MLASTSLHYISMKSLGLNLLWLFAELHASAGTTLFESLSLILLHFKIFPLQYKIMCWATLREGLA